MKRKSKTDGWLADLMPSQPVASSPKPAVPTVVEDGPPAILEYTPLAGSEAWRVEKFPLFCAEFQLVPPYAEAMRGFHEIGLGNPRPWGLACMLFGIGPVIPREGAQIEDLEAKSREQICALFNLAPDELQAEFDALRSLWATVLEVERTQEQEQAPALPPKADGTLTFGADVLAEFGFNEEMFEALRWDVATKSNKPRDAVRNRQERDWFIKRVTEWARVLGDPMGGGLARDTLLNELTLRRLEDELTPLSPNHPEAKALSQMKRETSEAYQRQLEQLQVAFPEMAFAGRLSFRASVADLIRAYLEYKARGDTRLVDKIRTATEVEVELRQSVQAPTPRYRFGLNIAIVEAMHGLYDPNFRPQFRPATLRKMDVAFRKAVEEVRQAQNEPLVDLEKGIGPGDGDEFPDLPDVPEPAPDANQTESSK